MKKKLTLGQKIKKARQQAGYSQRQLGSALKISDKAISSYEVDRAEPSLENLKAISKLTRTPFQYFIGEVDQEEADLATKLDNIAHELAEVKALLRKKKNK